MNNTEINLSLIGLYGTYIALTSDWRRGGGGFDVCGGEFRLRQSIINIGGIGDRNILAIVGVDLLDVVVVVLLCCGTQLHFGEIGNHLRCWRQHTIWCLAHIRLGSKLVFDELSK